MTTTTRESFNALFSTVAEAIEAENTALQAGAEFLPAFAQAVAAGGEPTPEYWTWLAGQVAGDEAAVAGTLHDYTTGDMLRAATADELAASIEAAEFDGGSGVIEVDGRSCYAV